MADSYLSLNQCDEQKYLIDIIAGIKEKCERASYADQRAQALIECEEFEIEVELQFAMEEITEKEKDLQQIVEVTSFLFERTQSLQNQCHDLQKSIDDNQIVERQLNGALEEANTDLRLKEQRVAAEEQQNLQHLETIKQLKNTIYDSQVQIRGLQQLEHKRTESLNEFEEVMRSKEAKIKLLQEELS